MTWEKLGIVYAPTGDRWWSKRYAGIPTALRLSEDLLRIYFWSATEESFDGRIGYVDVAANDPRRILNVSDHPVLDIGEPGDFDDCGVVPSHARVVDDGVMLYYLGVQRVEKRPYLYFTGMVKGDQDGSFFVRQRRTPILERTRHETTIRSALVTAPDGDGLRGWYVGASAWIEVDGRVVPRYAIKHARSVDGVTWNEDTTTCIGAANEHEYGFGRPWVVNKNGLFHMWYSVRSTREPYAIGYAVSDDGLVWRRRDSSVGIQRSATGWDSEMICYPCVVESQGHWYMFYCGNKHGMTGFGVARLTGDF